MNADPVRRIFVVGAPRSGTTLVQSLLAAHRETCSFKESHFFNRHFHRFPLTRRHMLKRNPWAGVVRFLQDNDISPVGLHVPLARLRRASPITFFDVQGTATSFVDLLDAIAEMKSASTWIEKTPRHLHYLSLIEAVAGVGTDAAVVHVLRDGREVAASLFAASAKWGRGYGLAECVRRWNRDLALTRSRLGHAGHAVVCYEDLCTDVDCTVRSLLGSLGLNYDDYEPRPHVDLMRRIIHPREIWKQDTGRPIAMSRTFDTALTSRQRQYVEKHLDLEIYQQVRKRLRGGWYA